jgi:hypothetical protein
MKNMKLFNNICQIRVFLILIVLLLINHCAKVDPVTGEKILIDPDTRKKSREMVDKGGGIFGDIGKNKSSGVFEFASSNVLWRATLKTLDFLPLANADYSGGVVVYDSNKTEKELIKVSVRFLSNELRASSLEIIGHKKICDESGKCYTEKLNNKFTEEIKDSIIIKARLLKIEDTKKDQEK